MGDNMTVSRRSFLGFLAALPILKIAFPSALSEGALDELIELPSTTIPMSLVADCKIFSTTNRRIEGPCHIRDFHIYPSSEDGPVIAFSFIRSDGSIIFKSRIGPHARFYWKPVDCAIVVPDNSFVEFAGEGDFLSWTTFEK